MNTYNKVILNIFLDIILFEDKLRIQYIDRIIELYNSLLSIILAGRTKQILLILIGPTILKLIAFPVRKNIYLYIYIYTVVLKMEYYSIA